MKCRVCDATNFEVAIDLGEQPWGNHFLKKEEVGKEPFYPLRVLYCTHCQTAQLDYTVPKEVMFSDHTYLSGITKSLKAHFEKLATEVDQQFFANKKSGKRALDIGSNDGSQLEYYKRLGYDVLGVESSKGTAAIAVQNGIPTRNAFFNLATAEEIKEPFDVINASGVFFHLEELHSVTEGIKKLLKPDGVFVVQFLYMKNIMDNTAFDQIYHEHLLYYTLKTLQVLLKRHDLELFDAYVSPIHGGSVMGFVGHPGVRQKTERLKKLVEEEERSQCNTLAAYHRFAEDTHRLKEVNLAYLQRAKAANKRVFGMGAPVKGNTLLNYFGVDRSLMECLVEKNRLRKGLYSPGSHLEIRIEEELTAPPDIYYVLAWNFKKEILNNNQHLIDQGVEFFFPINPKEV